MSVDFWIDPSCPWSWVTARWLREVEGQGIVQVRWRVMSLAVLNEGADLPPEWVEPVRLSWGPVRALLLVDREVGPDSVWPLLEAFAVRYHGEGRRDVAAILEESVAQCGLPPSIATAAWDGSVDDDVRASHRAAMALGGDDVGSPILGLPGPDDRRVGFYGPVIASVPIGAGARQLWDGVVALAGTEGFFELKRTRDVEPDLT